MIALCALGKLVGPMGRAYFLSVIMVTILVIILLLASIGAHAVANAIQGDLAKEWLLSRGHSTAINGRRFHWLVMRQETGLACRSVASLTGCRGASHMVALGSGCTTRRFTLGFPSVY
jgi:hypothetical protein